MNKLFTPAAFSILAISAFFFSFDTGKPSGTSFPSDSLRRKEDLKYILSLLDPDRTSNGRVSYKDKVFTDWLTRTGELPPDWDALPSIPYLPDPMLIRKNGKQVPVTTLADWNKKRKELKEQLQYYITGTYPEQPKNLSVKLLNETSDGQVTLRTVELSFGPKKEARLTIELLIPPGKGPFPVFMTNWNHREWAQIAVKRGYIGCVYAGADSKDDTEDYARIWTDQYDFTRLMRRAYGAFVAVDYLYTLPFVDKKKIGITGHSRNGKQSLMAAAFDERITAVVTSSAGSGAEVPWRYSSYPYDVEDIALLTVAQPAWLHPRLRFFTGRENKLPIDQNSFMALVAPRGLMVSTATNESATNPWGAEQALKSAGKAYRFLNAEDQIMIRYRPGLHGTSAKDIEGYVDFFDFVFKRSKVSPASNLIYDYSFNNWLALSKEKTDPLSFPRKRIDDILIQKDGKTLATQKAWEEKKESVRKHIQWLMGNEPPVVTNYGPTTLKNGGLGESYMGTFLKRPAATKDMEVMNVTPYKGFGDNLFGYLYYPREKAKNQKLPVLIYLHEYDYGKGFTPIGHQHELQSFFEKLTRQGYAVFSYDMMGFGNRMEEGTRFYERYPQWSKMGKLVSDVNAAVIMLKHLDIVDETKIFTAGYALGATVGLYATALNKDIAGTISVAGFTPMRTDHAGKGTQGIAAFSHLHGLLPRLGFFIGHEERIPTDFHEIISSIAPRPVLLIAPQKDWNTTPEDIRTATDEARKIYSLYGKEDHLELASPVDYNRLSVPMRQLIFDWCGRQ